MTLTLAVSLGFQFVLDRLNSDKAGGIFLQKNPHFIHSIKYFFCNGVEHDFHFLLVDIKTWMTQLKHCCRSQNEQMVIELAERSPQTKWLGDHSNNLSGPISFLIWNRIALDIWAFKSGRVRENGRKYKLTYWQLFRDLRAFSSVSRGRVWRRNLPKFHEPWPTISNQTLLRPLFGWSLNPSSRSNLSLSYSGLKTQKGKSLFVWMLHFKLRPKSPR